MTTSMLEKSVKTRNNLRESTTLDSSIFVLIVVVEKLDFEAAIELQSPWSFC